MLTSMFIASVVLATTPAPSRNVATLPPAPPPPPIQLPMEHRAHGWVERLQVRVPGGPLFASSKPYTRGDVVQFILWLEEQMAKGRLALGPGEEHDLAALRRELARELQVAGDPRETELEREALVLRDGEDDLVVDLYVTQTVQGTNEDTEEVIEVPTSNTTVGGRLRGALGGRLGFAADIRNTRLQGTASQVNFIPRQGVPATEAGSRGEFRAAADGYLSISTFIADGIFGKTGIDWGPARGSALLLGSSAYPFDQIQLFRNFGPLRFTALHGWLRGDEEPRYIAAHRLEARVHPRLVLGGAEAVVYSQGHTNTPDAGRGPQLEYLIPLFPLHVAEHYLGDFDNNMISFDFQWTPRNGVAVYGELLIDDFNTSRSWDHYGNKLAGVAGLHLVDPWGPAGVDVGLEYTWLDPWVYTHRVPGNSYTHFDRSLGHWLPPNSNHARAEVGWRATGPLTLHASVERVRTSIAHTAGSYGGYFVPDTNRPDPTDRNSPKHYMKGTIESTRRWAVAAEWEPSHEWFLRAEFSASDIENLAHVPENHFSFLTSSLQMRIEY